MAMHNYGQPMA